MNNQIASIQNYDPTKDKCYENQVGAWTHVFPLNMLICVCGKMRLEPYDMSGVKHFSVRINT